ncbi:hypothetical protein [Herbaspirillum rubrisubalbicans]|nr:hypothetical protein [Herbaspirillum rubrisubalbicans]
MLGTNACARSEVLNPIHPATGLSTVPPVTGTAACSNSQAD